MTIDQCIEAVMRGETSEQYKKRQARLRRLANERDDLQDAIEILEGDPAYIDKVEKKKARLTKVLKMIDELK